MSRAPSVKQLEDRIERHQKKAEKAAAQLAKLKAAQKARADDALSAAFLAIYKNADARQRQSIRAHLEKTGIMRSKLALVLAALSSVDASAPAAPATQPPQEKKA